MIVIKDEEVLRQILIGYHSVLVDIVLFIYAMEGKVVITCGYRHGDTGVHGTTPCRGIDLRSWVYPKPNGIATRVNHKWQYDPQRPEKVCALLHNTGSGEHLHLQVHPNTIKQEMI